MKPFNFAFEILSKVARVMYALRYDCARVEKLQGSKASFFLHDTSAYFLWNAKFYERYFQSGFQMD